MGTSEADEPGFSPALRPVVFRAYKITNEWFDKGKKVSELEAYLCKNDKRLFVERIRQKRVMNPFHFVFIFGIRQNTVEKMEICVITGLSSVI